MSRFSFGCLALSVLAIACSPGHAVAQKSLESGVAITDSEALRELDATSWSLGALLAPGWQRGAKVAPSTNNVIATLPAFAPLREAVRKQFSDYEKDYEKRFGTDAVIGFDINRNHRLFDNSFLRRASGRFELVGIVNRMDRAYKDPAGCGETRLIYRLAYREKQARGVLESRLPMSLNVVFRARDPDGAFDCAEIAKRWLASGTTGLAGAALARKLSQPDGLLATLAPKQIERLESNIQVIRVPTGESSRMGRLGGHAEYLLNVFKRTNPDGAFEMHRLENQPDRSKLFHDASLRDDFKRWLFTRETIEALAEGTIVIPDRFLAQQAISMAPGSTARPGNRPFLDIIKDADVAKAFQTLGIKPGDVRNIDTVLGFQQRLNDVTCSGCHQSRAIGGFHFMGADRAETIKAMPQNAIFVPASPHFYGEAPRRKAIVTAFAEGGTPSWLRGFSLRPRADQAKGALAGTQIRDGWGATCYIGQDQSFKDWTCRDRSLTCRTVIGSPHEPGFGMCMTNAADITGLKIGDPFQFGTYRSEAVSHDYLDDFAEKVDLSRARGSAVRAGARQGGGFFGGMIKARGSAQKCTGLPAEAVCAREAGNEFNSCVSSSGGDFKDCLKNNTNWAGLRRCDIARPCRDDYVCLATNEPNVGACLPPYFLFQFRVDGHPLEKG